MRQNNCIHTTWPLSDGRVQKCLTDLSPAIHDDIFLINNGGGFLVPPSGGSRGGPPPLDKENKKFYWLNWITWLKLRVLNLRLKWSEDDHSSSSSSSARGKAKRKTAIFWFAPPPPPPVVSCHGWILLLIFDRSVDLNFFPLRVPPLLKSWIRHCFHHLGGDRSPCSQSISDVTANEQHRGPYGTSRSFNQKGLNNHMPISC